jgi:hypothetical protein
MENIIQGDIAGKNFFFVFLDESTNFKDPDVPEFEKI